MGVAVPTGSISQMFSMVVTAEHLNILQRAICTHSICRSDEEQTILLLFNLSHTNRFSARACFQMELI